VLVQVFGPEDAAYLLHLTGKLIGMQYFHEIAKSFAMDQEPSRGSAKDFVAFLRVMFESQDDVAEISTSEGAFEVRQQSWKLMADVADYHPACANVLKGLLEGLAAGCGRHIPVHLKPSAGGRAPFVWSIG
jgi:hypothetical protein